MQLRQTLFPLCLVALFIVSCAAPQPMGYERTGEVKCLSHDRETITLASKAMGSTSSEAQFNADVKAFENLFYKGVPNSNQEAALVDSKKKDEVADQLVEFFNSGEYKHYLMESTVMNQSVNKGTYFVDQKVHVHLSALRKYLEDNNIIRKFGI